MNAFIGHARDEHLRRAGTSGGVGSALLSHLFTTKRIGTSVSFSFEKRKAVSFLLFGSLFLVFSIIAPIKIYYVISGLALLSLSVFTRLFGKKTA